MTIWALHGFLGLPSDFDSLKENLGKSRADLKWHVPDYLHTRELSSMNSLSDWGLQFNQWVMSKEPQSTERILLGYSQGGRLCLQAFKQNPGLWKGLILLSVNPGIRSGEKPVRLKSDQEWAARFLNEKFDRVVQDWNSQAVFKGSQMEPLRKESNYNRHQLADALVNWSVANQEDFRNLLSTTQTPIFYIAGENDHKYRQIGETLHVLNPKIYFQALKNSGHRVLFDQPVSLATVMGDWLNSYCK